MKNLSLVLVVLLMTALVSACAQEPPSNDEASQDEKAMGSTEKACLEDLSPEERKKTLESWIGGPMPTEVGGTEDCNFYDFAWQAFLALAAEEGDAPVFTGLGSSDGLFPESGTPLPYPGHATPGTITAHQLNKHTSSGHFRGDPVVNFNPDLDPIGQAASLVPLVDQQGRWIHYSVMTNQIEYDEIASLGLYTSDCYDFWGGSTAGAVKYAPPDPSASPPSTGVVTVTCAADPPEICAENVADDPLPRLPTGSLELKLAWKVLETCNLPDSPESGCVPDKRSYITVTGNVAPYSPTIPSLDGVTLGLVGIHILPKTPDYPDRVWITFEHRDNDPDCPGPAGDGDSDGGSDGDGDWIFYDGVRDRDNMFCTPCPIPLDSWTGRYAKFAQTALEQARSCDQDPSPSCAILTDDQKALECTNDPGAFNLAKPTLYRPGTDRGECPKNPIPTQVCRKVPIPQPVASLNGQVESVLEAYSSVLARYQLVGVAWFEQDCGSSPTCVEKGVRRLSNTTMETFEQGLGSPTGTGPSGCLVCHGTNQFNPSPYAYKPYAAGIADRSFMFMRIQQLQGETCSAPKPSYQCPACPAMTKTVTPQESPVS